jgi:hypothetical protein
MAKRQNKRELDPPDPDKIADSIVRRLPAGKPNTIRIIVHGLVLLMFKSRTSLTLVLPKEGAPDSQHRAFGKAYESNRRGRPLALSGAHWALKGHKMPADPVRRLSRHGTDHPLNTIERVLDMSDVVGDVRMRSLSELIQRDLLDASINISGADVRSEVPFAPLGWGVLWAVPGKEVLCTDTAILTIRTEGDAALKGRSFASGEPLERQLGRSERDLFIGNIDTKRCRQNNRLELDETAGYIRLFPAGRTVVPRGSRTFLDFWTPPRTSLRAQRSVAVDLLLKIKSAGCSPVCNLAQDLDEGWDDKW